MHGRIGVDRGRIRATYDKVRLIHDAVRAIHGQVRLYDDRNVLIGGPRQAILDTYGPFLGLENSFQD